MSKFPPKELVLDGATYVIDIDSRASGLSATRGGLSATWSCSLCRASGRIGLSNGTEEEMMQVVFDIVRAHHAKLHSAKP